MATCDPASPLEVRAHGHQDKSLLVSHDFAVNTGKGGSSYVSLRGREGFSSKARRTWSARASRDPTIDGGVRLLTRFRTECPQAWRWHR